MILCETADEANAYEYPQGELGWLMLQADLSEMNNEP